MGLRRWLAQQLTDWLVTDKEPTGTPPCDFDRLSFEIRACDVLLVEGRSRVSDVIKNITQSPWTHAALYIGRLHDIQDDELKERLRQHYDGADHDQLIIEALLGEGTIVSPLTKYQGEHLRICRPTGLSPQDAYKVIEFCIRQLGIGYNVRHILDLARFMFPYAILPRRWRSSLFEHNAGTPTRTVCSSMIAAAFTSVHFPILPVIHRDEHGDMRLYKRNTQLYTPRDFDYSPYFDIIKYPFLGQDDVALYRQLPWDEEGVICNDVGDCFLPPEALSPTRDTDEAPGSGADEPDAETSAAANESGEQSTSPRRAAEE